MASHAAVAQVGPRPFTPQGQTHPRPAPPPPPSLLPRAWSPGPVKPRSRQPSAAALAAAAADETPAKAAGKGKGKGKVSKGGKVVDRLIPLYSKVRTLLLLDVLDEYTLEGGSLDGPEYCNMFAERYHLKRVEINDYSESTKRLCGN
jgi:hypothetical protein